VPCCGTGDEQALADDADVRAVGVDHSRGRARGHDLDSGPEDRGRWHRGPSPKITPCALCGEPATDWSYDGLDPNEQRDSRTGRAWSADMAHYRPVCAAH